jgi:predicted nucleotide-binding protein (sugar kinase/HSP70/actin superfamily)
MFPGFRLGLLFEIHVLWGIIMADVLEDLRRKIRPYETKAGETDSLFDTTMTAITDTLGAKGIGAAVRVFKKGIRDFCNISYDRSVRKKQVFIIGEFLLNFHPGSNFGIESYLEAHGLEVIFPRLTDIFWRNYLVILSEIKDFHVNLPFSEVISSSIIDGFFEFAVTTIERIALKHPLYEASLRLSAIATLADPIMHRTFTSGEGYIIPGEITHHARAGVKSFIILQPFGCLPNHIAGRGIVKRLKEDFPDIQILPLDYDPDTSFANIENRLQMLIMNARE